MIRVLKKRAGGLQPALIQGDWPVYLANECAI